MYKLLDDTASGQPAKHNIVSMMPSPPTSPPSKVNLLHLAAASIAATLAAAQPIREMSNFSESTKLARDILLVEEEQPIHPQQKQQHAKNTNARWKEDGTIVTDADFTAQGCIVRVLRRVQGDFVIIGEESPEEMEEHMARHVDQQKSEDVNAFLHCAQLEVFNRYHGIKECPLAQGGIPDLSTTPYVFPSVESDEEDTDLLVDASRVRVFVDPLDGTKSYQNGDFDAVTILVAIILDGTPHFGVITKPFGCKDHPSVLETNCVTFYGGPMLKHVFIAGVADPCVKPETSRINLPRAIISSSRSVGVVQNFVDHLATLRQLHSEPLQVSGAGEKSLRLVVGTEQEALWFFPKAGTARWDVAASDALLRALGGRLTDKYGRDLNYLTSREDSENVDGIIASNDAALHEECIRLFNEGSRDWDILE